MDRNHTTATFDRAVAVTADWIRQFVRRNEWTLLTWITILYYTTGYFNIHLLLRNREWHTLALPFDSLIPFLPYTIFVYLQVFIMVFIPLVVIDDIRTMRRLFLAYSLNLSISYLTFLLFPVHYPRFILPVDSFTHLSVLTLWHFDPPTNCFPSLHVSMAYLSSFICLRLDRRVGAGMVLLATAVTVSTLTMKQHYFLDLVAGILLAVFAFGCFFHQPAQRRFRRLTRWIEGPGS